MTLPEREFHSYAAAGGNQLSGALLLQVDDAGRVRDHFRISLSGPVVRGQFRAAEFTTAPEIAELKFGVEVNPEELKFKPNRFATKWVEIGRAHV